MNPKIELKLLPFGKKAAKKEGKPSAAMWGRFLMVSAVLLARASQSETDFGNFIDLTGLDDLSELLGEYSKCLEDASDKLQPKSDAMETACANIGFWDDSSETRLSIPMPQSVENGDDNGGVPNVDIPSLDLDRIEGANTQLFADFCYEAPQCKNAFKELLRTAVNEFGGCVKKLGGNSGDGFSEFEDVLELIDDLCPILTHRFVAKFTLNGELEDYNTDEAKAKIIAAILSASGLAIAPLATVNLKSGSVIAEVTIPVSGEEQAKAAKTQLEANDDLDSALADAGLDGATVQSGSLDVQVEEETDGLSAGVIAGIVVGSVVLVVLLAGLVYFILRSKSKDRDKKAEPTDPSPPVVTGDPVKSGGHKAADAVV